MSRQIPYTRSTIKSESVLLKGHQLQLSSTLENKRFGDSIINVDCLDLLEELNGVPLIFADPPDNLGLEYSGYKDSKSDYYDWMYRVIKNAIRASDCFWLSYYWKHDLEIKSMVRSILKYDHPSVKAKTFIWRFTFGQYMDSDCGSGFRYLLRLEKPSARRNPDAIRVISKRTQMGDKRASGLKVPDDVWEFPRIVAPSPERREWHPTQHPEALISRIVQFSSNVGDLVVDLFGGTGTTLRVCGALRRKCLISEISQEYCERILKDVPV